MEKSFRHTAGFGKRIEYWIIGQMLKEGLDVYVPLVDDDAIDAVVKGSTETYITVQIKGRSKDVQFGHAALFAAIPHRPRKDYWFVLHSERMNTTWILTSAEFIKESRENKSGRNKGKHALKLNGVRRNTLSGKREEYCLKRFEKYIANNFNRLVDRH